MAQQTLERPDTDEPSRIDRHWDDEFNQLTQADNTGRTQADYDKEFDDLTSNLRDQENQSQAADNDSSVADQEASPSGGWRNNTSSKPDDQANSKLKSRLKGVGGIIKKRGAIIAIVSLFGGGALVPFLGSATLPFSILGNLDSTSLLQPLNAYLEDYYGYKFFMGGKVDSASSNGEKFAGLRDTEIEQLKKQGVNFPEEGKKLRNGKTVFTQIEVDGKLITASSFKESMRANPSLRSKMIFGKGSYYKSARSAAAKKVRNIFKFRTNPDGVKADTPEETNKNIVERSVDDSSGSASSSSTGAGEGSEETDEFRQSKTDAEDLVGSMNETIEDVKSDPIGKIETVDSGTATGERVGAVEDVTSATKNLGGKIFSYVNTMDVADAVCTIYQVSYTAQVLARTVAVANLVRYGMYFRTVLERTKAGEDTDNSVNYLLDQISKKDSATGLAFDQSAIAKMLFTGSLSSEPRGISAVGGELLLVMYTAMHGLHSVVGTLFTLGLADNDARAGRKLLKNGCAIATNLGVQVGVTVGDAVLTFFTGGASKAATSAAKASAKAGLEYGRELFTKNILSKFSRGAIKDFIKQQTESVGEKLALKNLRKTSMSLLKNTAKEALTNPWNAVGLLAGTAGMFAMPYIVQTLSGGDIAGYITSGGLLNFEAATTGFKHWEAVNALASGGQAATYSAATAYSSTLKEYQDSYVADLRFEAKDTPLDANNPYSTLGSVMYSMQKAVGVSNATNIFSSIAATIALPLKRLSGVAKAATPVSQEALGESLGNPYYQSKNVAVQVSGDPQVIFNKTNTFEEVMEKIGPDSSNPMITYSSDDETTGEPKLSIKAGTELDTYAQKCHNPDATEMDPEFANDNESNYYDFDYCAAGGSNNPANAALYTDAVAFIQQVSPSETNSTGSQASSSSSLPEGTIQELSQKILDNPNITLSSGFDNPASQIQNMAQGKDAQPVTAYSKNATKEILQVILVMAENHTFSINSFVRQWMTAGGYSQHPYGRAVDLGNIDGSCNDGGANCVPFIQDMINKKVLPPGGGIGQQYCSGRGSINAAITAAGWNTFEDSCNHLHIDLGAAS